MSKVKFVSFWTDGYGPYADKLIESLAHHDLDFEVVRRESLGSWRKNVQYKPIFITNKIGEYANKGYEAIVWIDADAIVHEYPWLIVEKLAGKWRPDFAGHFRDGRELVLSVGYFRASFKVWQGCRKWAELCQNDEIFNKLFCPEQSLLQAELPKLGWSVFHLPSEYCKIFDLEEQNDRARKVVKVIGQYQASRVMRKEAC